MVKKIIYSNPVSDSYSLQGFSSYDIIWIVEEDFLLLKKYLDQIFDQLPQNIPKLGLVTKNGEEMRQKMTFKKYSLFDIINLKNVPIPERKNLITEKCYSYMLNPTLGLTPEFVQQNRLTDIALGYYGLGMLGVLGLGYLSYKYLYRRIKVNE